MQQHLQSLISATLALALIEATHLISLALDRSDVSQAQGVSAICLVCSCSEQTQAVGRFLVSMALYGMIDKSRDDACKTQLMLMHRWQWQQYRSQMTPHITRNQNVYCSFGH